MKKQPIKVDKRSKAYKDSQKKFTSNKNIQKLKDSGLLLSESEMNKAIKSGLIIHASDVGKLSPDDAWTINSIIREIQYMVDDIKKHNIRLTNCVNNVVYIQREESDPKSTVKRSDTVTDNLDDIKWQLKEVSDTYYKELEILERYIGTSK